MMQQRSYQPRAARKNGTAITDIDRKIIDALREDAWLTDKDVRAKTGCNVAQSRDLGRYARAGVVKFQAVIQRGYLKKITWAKLMYISIEFGDDVDGAIERICNECREITHADKIDRKQNSTPLEYMIYYEGRSFDRIEEIEREIRVKLSSLNKKYDIELWTIEKNIKDTLADSSAISDGTLI